MFTSTERDDVPRIEGGPDNRSKRFTVSLILGLVVPLFILALVYSFQFRQLSDPDTLDMAQLGRNIAAGRHFTTSVVRPLATTHSRDVMHMPEMIHGPAYPCALALVFGPNASERKVFGTAALFYLLTIPVLYLITKGMFNQKVGRLAVVAYATSAFALNMVAQAGTGPMLGFVFTAMSLAMFRYVQESGSTAPDARKRLLKHAAVAGLLFGLCYATEYIMLFAFLPVALFMYLCGGQHRRAGFGVFLAGFAVLALPLMIRNATVAGNPFFGLRAVEIGMGTAAHPGLSLYRSTVPQSVLGLLREAKGDIFRKLWQGVNQAYSGFPIMGQPYLMAFFVAGLFYSFRRSGVNAVRGMLLGSFFCVVIFSSLFLFQLSVVAAFTPLLMAFAAAYFIRMLTDANPHAFVGKCITALVVIVLCIPLVTLVIQPSTARTADHSSEEQASAFVGPNVPILTDRALETTWYGARTTIWLPDTEKDVENLSKLGVVKAIYLSSNLHPSVRTTENYDIWRGWYGPVFEQAARGQFARMTTAPLDEFALYRDMPEEAAVSLLQKGGLLFLRPGATKK